MNFIKTIKERLKKYNQPLTKSIRVLVLLLCVVYTSAALFVVLSTSIASIIGIGPLICIIGIGYLGLFFDLYMLGQDDRTKEENTEKRKIGF